MFQNEKGDNVLVTSVAKGEFYNEYQRIKKKIILVKMGLLIYSMYLDKRFLVEKMGKVIPMLKCSLKLVNTLESQLMT